MHFDDRSTKEKSGIIYQRRVNKLSPSRIEMRNSTRSNFYDLAGSPFDGKSQNVNSRLSVCNGRVDASTEMIRFRKQRERRDRYGRSASCHGSSRKRKHKIFETVHEDGRRANWFRTNHEVIDQINRYDKNDRHDNPMTQKIIEKKSRQKSQKTNMREVNRIYNLSNGLKTRAPVYITYSNQGLQNYRQEDLKKTVPVGQLMAPAYPHPLKQQMFVTNEIQQRIPEQLDPHFRVQSLPRHLVYPGYDHPGYSHPGYGPPSYGHPAHGHPSDCHQVHNPPSNDNLGPVIPLSPLTMKPELTKLHEQPVEVRQGPNGQALAFDKNGYSQNFKTSASSRNQMTLPSFLNTKPMINKDNDRSSTSPMQHKEQASNLIPANSRARLGQCFPEEDGETDRFFDMDVNSLNLLRHSTKQKSYLQGNIETSSLQSSILNSNKNIKNNDFEGIKSPLDEEVLFHSVDKQNPSACVIQRVFSVEKQHSPVNMIQRALNTVINTETEGKMITMVLISIGALLVLFQLLR